MVPQIIFVEHSKDRLLESIKALRAYPVHKVILAVGQQDSSGERKTRKIANEIADELRTVWDVEIVEIDINDVIKAAYQLVSVIKKKVK